LERAQRQREQRDDDRGEQQHEHSAGAVDERVIERAANSEIDRDERDDERDCSQGRRAARDDQRLEAVAKRGEVGFELRLCGHAANPLRILRCQFPPQDSTIAASSSAITSAGPNGRGTGSVDEALALPWDTSAAPVPSPFQRASVASSIRVKSDSRGSKFTATSSVLPPPTTS